MRGQVTKAQLAALTELVSTLSLDGLQAHLTRVPTDPAGLLRLTVRDRWVSLHYRLPPTGGHSQARPRT